MAEHGTRSSKIMKDYGCARLTGIVTTWGMHVRTVVVELFNGAHPNGLPQGT